MKKIYILFLISIFLFSFLTDSYARRSYYESPDFAYLRGRLAEFKNIFQTLGRKSFFNLINTYNKNYNIQLTDTIEKRIKECGLKTLKSELALIGPLGKRFLNKIPEHKIETEQIKFIKNSIKYGLQWHIKEMSNTKDAEIIKELDILEKKILLVPKIIIEKRVEKNERLLTTPMIDFRKFNFETKGFGQIFIDSKSYCLARLITLLVSAQYLSKGHTATGIIGLTIGRYHERLTAEYINFLTMSVASDLDSLNIEDR
ncbi:hypothetical protein KAJ27_18090 [bacterium]|nr:hypothetical protein [bacterium]